jgi:hypothetical protein
VVLVGCLSERMDDSDGGTVSSRPRRHTRIQRYVSRSSIDFELSPSSSTVSSILWRRRKVIVGYRCSHGPADDPVCHIRRSRASGSLALITGS